MEHHFTDRASKVMLLAGQEAQRLGHEAIGPEHILLGVVEEGSGVAANVLAGFDVSPRRLRKAIESMARPGDGPGRPFSQSLPLTPQAQSVVRQASEEARGLNHNYVGTEHLLLGLLHEQGGVAALALNRLGLEAGDVREEIQYLLNPWADRGDEEAPPVPRPARPALRKKARAAREYDLYLPLRYNDGRPVEQEQVDAIKRHLTERFGGLAFFPQKSEGTWKIGSVTFREEMVILRVLAVDGAAARDFFAALKEQLKADLQQEDILIVERKVRIL
jgi:ATP-dependent Clp protease ATP-binding subunit ClpA